MFEIGRRVRFRLDPGSPGPRTSAALGAFNAFYELEVRCVGRPDPVTGYVIGISSIDAAVRETAVPLLQDAMRGGRSPQSVLPEVVAALERVLPGLAGVRWWLSPYHCLAMRDDDRVILSRRFEFAASHRLHCPDLTPERNREIFGKCNNPTGHGHNYWLEVAVEVPLNAPAGAPRLGVERLDELVESLVLHRFDHKHLNLDTREFAELNPSVENISKVCHDLLSQPVSEAGGRLVRVTVWETEKTSCTYPVTG